MKLPTISINKDILKIIALVTMTIDHMATYLNFMLYREVGDYIGRMSFPIFAFLLIEHLYKKQIYKKYIVRLSLFGLLTFALLFPYHGKVSENPIYPLNILFTFLNAVLFLLCYEWINKEPVPRLMKVMAQIFNFICFGLIATTCHYGIFGFCYLIMFYFYFKYPTKVRYILILILSVLLNTSNYWWVISLITTLCLLQTQGDANQKRLLKHWWVFYAYYPLHLWIIVLISYYR